MSNIPTIKLHNSNTSLAVLAGADKWLEVRDEGITWPSLHLGTDVTGYLHVNKAQYNAGYVDQGYELLQCSTWLSMIDKFPDVFI